MFSTGFRSIDALTGGITPGTLTILSGFTSIGKSALTQNLMLNIAEAGTNVAYFEFEGGWQQRFMAMSGRFENERYSMNNFSPDERSEIHVIGEKISQLPIEVGRLDSEDDDDTGNEVFDRMVSDFVEFAKSHSPSLLVIDPIERLDISFYAPDAYANVGNTLLRLQKLAREYQCAIIATHHIPSMAGESNGFVPTLDIMPYGELMARRADSIWLLDRRSKYCQSNLNLPALLTIIRKGVSADIALDWDGDHLRFSEPVHA